MKILVIYAYHESPGAKANLDFFNKYGLYRTEDVTYQLFINGPTCSVKLCNRWSKVKYRNNIGLDFGAWHQALNEVNINEYTHFIFMNDTIRGPFKEKRWIKKFLDLIDESTKLVGLSICCYKGYMGHTLFHDYMPHVQSMLLCTDKIGLNIIYPKIINNSNLDRAATIALKEIGASKEILNANYNIRAILKKFQADYREKHNRQINANNGHGGDPWYENSYFGETINFKDMIFVKSNRNISIDILKEMTKKQYKKYWY